ncbi:hypothetical protein L596_006247 [Steinernema carpocapsae]|uniref:Uncharacterized protein n=1 Tax=Steinernema carpocapsae TaxID=34508 RepID=A0A4U8V1H6_STECR|nr:hypothetical protein L596_006247 [Steinernema carpocapsae]
MRVRLNPGPPQGYTQRHEAVGKGQAARKANLICGKGSIANAFKIAQTEEICHRVHRVLCFKTAARITMRRLLDRIRYKQKVDFLGIDRGMFVFSFGEDVQIHLPGWFDLKLRVANLQLNVTKKTLNSASDVKSVICDITCKITII